MVEVYNGVTNSTIYKGLDDELAPTSGYNLLNETHTNGMQFKPAVYNSNKPLDKLYVFDPSLLMFISYTKTELIRN